MKYGMAVDFRLRGWVIGKVSRPRLYIFRQICKYKTTNNRMYVCLYDKRALRHLLIFLSNKKQKRKIKQNKKNSHEERLVLQKNTFRHSCLQNLRRYVLVFWHTVPLTNQLRFFTLNNLRASHLLTHSAHTVFDFNGNLWKVLSFPAPGQPATAHLLVLWQYKSNLKKEII